MKPSMINSSIRPLQCIITTAGLVATLFTARAQITPGAEIPASLNHLSYDGNGRLTVKAGGQTYIDAAKTDDYKLPDMMGSLTGVETGILLDLNRPGFNGTIAY